MIIEGLLGLEIKGIKGLPKICIKVCWLWWLGYPPKK